MLAGSRVVAFSATAQPDAARAFYRDALGLKLIHEDNFALVFEGIRVAKVPQVTAPSYTVLGWHVEDIAAAIRDLNSRGVSFERFGFFEQDDLGIWTAPGGAQVAWFKDPDGNILSLTQG
jgi:catechol 2,3-dioxygenase-like lactoylglutathione lyase family enzyme